MRIKKIKLTKRIKINGGKLRYAAVALVIALGIFSLSVLGVSSQTPKAQTANVKMVDGEILASGSLAAQNQVNLTFQTGGKIVYLPFKEGDYVYEGQTVAQLDTTALQEELQIALNNYEIAKNNTSQTLENQKAGVLEGQTRYSLDTTNKQGYSAVPETDVIYDTVKNIVDNANMSENSAQINVSLANYALSLGTLVSPINGILLHEDVTTPGVNITPLTTFTVADPSSMVFSANVRQQDINYVNVGSLATIILDGENGQKFQGVVDKIYPGQTTDSNGESVYRVDIKINDLPNDVNFGQKGTILIKSNVNQNVVLIPSWVVLSDSYVWVLNNNKPVLRPIKIGSAFDGQTEVLTGLSDKDKIITDPHSLIIKLYSML